MAKRLRSYADVNSSDLLGLRQSIEERREVRCDLANTKCLISWYGATPPRILELGRQVRTHAEALEYYNDPVNGWAIEEDI